MENTAVVDKSNTAKIMEDFDERISKAIKCFSTYVESKSSPSQRLIDELTLLRSDTFLLQDLKENGKYSEVQLFEELRDLKKKFVEDLYKIMFMVR